MKLLIILSALCVVAYGGKFSPELQAVYIECLQTAGINEEALKEIQEHQNIEKLKCVKQCVMEKLDLINKDGTINKEKVSTAWKEEMARQESGFSDTMAKLLNKCVDEANAVEVTGKCDRAGTLQKCIIQNLVKQ